VTSSHNATNSAEQPLELTPFGLSETADHLVLGNLHGREGLALVHGGN
jgi:hypothetical protein